MPDQTTEAVARTDAIPMIGLGTYSKQGDVGLEAMLTALELGYRHIDTAQSYGNEDKVGQAVKQSGLDRGSVHVTTKIAVANLTREKLRPSLEASLTTLGTDYVDLTLVHWPFGPGSGPMADYLEELALCQQDGLTRSIGVSNFTRAHLDEAVSTLGKGVIRNNQFEAHPFLQNRLLRAKCEELGILVTGYMPVAGGAVMDDEVIKGVAARHGASPSQVAIAWLVQHGIVAIPSSKSRDHIEENLKAADISLTADDMAEIDALDRGYRIIKPERMASEWDS